LFGPLFFELAVRKKKMNTVNLIKKISIYQTQAKNGVARARQEIFKHAITTSMTGCIAFGQSRETEKIDNEYCLFFQTNSLANSAVFSSSMLMLMRKSPCKTQ
jgi:hypothetical protein